ncbi:ATP-binding protein [Acinetobacter johnsonii]|uniref:ATP-binding protein n=1 Tax=Acinetobacter johnsonii TaxID=40214 RepID=UPI00244CB4C2|nr:ATP-binding protein [Acinetobacter johnsonii]MDH1068954.1 ATP-binding protein [Acinetobacter johnsonii]
MLETGQLMEKFRHLSRDIQIGLQASSKNLEAIKSNYQGNSEVEKLEKSLGQIKDAWDAYYGWILLSSLDNIDEASANCAPGYVDVRSKIIRAINQRQKFISQLGVKVDIQSVPLDILIETYIPYFEQLLDLVLDNAIKYSPVSGEIEFIVTRDDKGVKILVQSIGPSVIKHEIDRLGQKGFRSENAKKMAVMGQGYGLYNVTKLTSLLKSRHSFHPEAKILTYNNDIPQSIFMVKLSFPESV